MTNPSRAEIWLVNLDPSLGDEMRKLRPAVVTSRDATGVLALRVVVPITGWNPRFRAYPWMVRLDPDRQNALDKTSAADAFQIRSISIQRFARLVGRLTDADMGRISHALRGVLDI